MLFYTWLPLKDVTLWHYSNCTALVLQEFDSLELTQEKINSITDKIPQRPVGVVEGTSYTLIILAAFSVRTSPPVVSPLQMADCIVI